MGCTCSRSTAKTIVKGNKISEIRTNVISINKKEEVGNKRLPMNRDYFYSVQKKIWLVILDYLPYKDLCQARKLNKDLNKAAKNQDLLLKFYKNRKSVNNINENILKFEVYSIINNNKNVNNHYNYTTINNYSNVDLTNPEFNKFVQSTKFSQEKYSNKNSSNLTTVPTFTEMKKYDTIPNNNSALSSIESPLQKLRIDNSGYKSKKIFVNFSNNYIDIFSKDEVDMGKCFTSLNLNQELNYSHTNRSSSDYSQHCKTLRSNLTPSFSQDYSFNQKNTIDVENLGRSRKKYRHITVHSRRGSNKFQSAGNARKVKSLLGLNYELPLVRYGKDNL